MFIFSHRFCGGRSSFWSSGPVKQDPGRKDRYASVLKPWMYDLLGNGFMYPVQEQNTHTGDQFNQDSKSDRNFKPFTP